MILVLRDKYIVKATSDYQMIYKSMCEYPILALEGWYTKPVTFSFNKKSILSVIFIMG